MAHFAAVLGQRQPGIVLNRGAFRAAWEGTGAYGLGVRMAPAPKTPPRSPFGEDRWFCAPLAAGPD